MLLPWGHIRHPAGQRDKRCTPHLLRPTVCHTLPEPLYLTCSLLLREAPWLPLYWRIKRVTQECLVQSHLPGGSGTTRTLVIPILLQGMRSDASEVCNRFSQLPSYYFGVTLELHFKKSLKSSPESTVWWCTPAAQHWGAEARGALSLQPACAAQ